MKKQWLFLLSVGIIGISLYAWNPFSRSSWEDLGNKIQEKVIQPMKTGFEENIIAPIEKKKEYGRKLKNGADMLSNAAPQFREKIAPLKEMPTKLVAGRTKLEKAVSDIHKTKTDVTKQLNDLDQKTAILTRMGQKALVAEIKSALNDLKAALAKLANTDDAGKCKGGALCDLLQTTNENEKYSRDQISKIEGQINELESKVHAGQGGCIGDLPARMRSTGNFLAI